jgi:hypothetical protein
LTYSKRKFLNKIRIYLQSIDSCDEWVMSGIICRGLGENIRRNAEAAFEHTLDSAFEELI